jgi:hypothetical protein
MINDFNLKMAAVRERTYIATVQLFADRGYSLNKKLNAQKAIQKEFKAKVSILYDNYAPVCYNMYFHGAIRQTPLLEPLKILFTAMHKDLGLQSINNYLWSGVFFMGDFYPELHNEYSAVRKGKKIKFESFLELEDGLLEMVHILAKKALPVVDVFLNIELMKEKLPLLIEEFRDEYLNIYSFLLFTALYDKEKFNEMFALVIEVVDSVKKRGDKWSVYFDHLEYVREHLISNYL